MDETAKTKTSNPDLMTEGKATGNPGIPGMGGCESSTHMGPLLFTKSQAAEMLSLSESSIEWLIRKRTVPHRKIAGKIRFTQADLEALIEASAVTQCCAAE